MGSITTETDREFKDSNDCTRSLEKAVVEEIVRTCCVLISTLDNQQPKPGCEWYHPTTISGLMSGEEFSSQRAEE
jgi:hypothetical protein